MSTPASAPASPASRSAPEHVTRVVPLLQALIREPSVNRGSFDVSDGDERRCAELLGDFLQHPRIELRTLEMEPKRTNLVARLRGNGKKPPILLNAHLDVVEANAEEWSHPPFSGEIADGYVWGRGAIDMKHMAALSACALRSLAESGEVLERDIIFAGVADEEAGCKRGATFLVDQHPDLVRAEYVLGEIGAFSLFLFGQTFYPIQVAEKGMVWVEAKVKGDAGHGSMPNPESAPIKLGRALARLGKRRFPMHPTEAAHKFIHGLADRLPQPQRAVLRRLTMPRVAGLILDALLRDPSSKRTFGALLSNTASPTVLRAGHKTNVIPAVATCEIDGRTLPGQTESAFLGELRAILQEDVELRVLHSMPPVETTTDTALYSHLVATLKQHDPMGTPIPFMIPGFTDAKAYSRLGAHCYGFSPVKFDPTADISFSAMYHGKNERVPVAGLEWGAEVMHDTLLRFCRGFCRGFRRE
jgi:acetylornithine deacetylase/succinyl-diaminopimelate desuccinylase-like protein